MKVDRIDVLDESVEIARGKGYPVTGWTMQSGDDGYCAWLYIEDEEQSSVFEEINVYGTPDEAANSCREQAEALPPVGETDLPFMFGAAEGEG